MLTNKQLFSKYAFIFLLAFAVTNVYAQKNRHISNKNERKASNKAFIKQETGHLLVKDFLKSTAKIMFIDSIVVDRKEALLYVPYTVKSGKIVRQDQIFGNGIPANDTLTAYINGFSDRCIFSKSIASGKTNLVEANKIGGKWKIGRTLTELGNEFEHIGFPYLMSDGITLYFSAIDKKNSFGGRDIFMTRLNTDSMKFYKPENIGLPYNSKDNDYFCIMDDINKLGWLATDRNQPYGKVCIYTFVPSDERWMSETTALDEIKLAELADVKNIKATQYDKGELSQARERLKLLKEQASINLDVQKNITEQDTIYFIINDSTIYRSINEFKSPTGRNMFLTMQKLKKEQKENRQKLEYLYNSATMATKKTTKKNRTSILDLEYAIEANENEIKILEKKIRNAENLL